MDDRFMHGLKREPAPDFGRALREQLRREEQADTEPAPRPLARLVPLLAPAVLVLALASVILFPSVRASAQAFLELFRIRNFTAVSVNPERIRQLEDGKLDLKALMGDRIQTVKEPGPAQFAVSPALAGAQAGFMVKVPTVLPSGLQADSVMWRGAGEARITADVSRLQRLLETLEIRDVAVPLAIDGQVIDVKMPPMVEQRFRGAKVRANLLQSRSPEIGLPTGVNLAELGEIGLRILGLDAAEARRLSQTIDWRSTMLVPVPGNAGSFRQVDVSGNHGLLVTAVGQGADGRQREGAMVLWSEGEMVFALAGNVSSVDLLQMANSVQ